MNQCTESRETVSLVSMYSVENELPISYESVWYQYDTRRYAISPKYLRYIQLKQATSLLSSCAGHFVQN